jgi:hypothetical protein
MSEMAYGGTTRGAERHEPMTLATALDLVSYWLVMISVYFTVGVVFFLGGVEKLFTGRIAAPPTVAQQFSGTFLARFLGISFWWGVLGVVEMLVFLVLLASLVTGEFLPSHRKSLLFVALSLALVLFSFLSFGQNLSGNFAGAATQWNYFGITAIVIILVQMLPPNRPRRWLSGGRAGEHD